MERKEAADVASREQDARLEATHAVVFALQVESDNIADEQEERSKARGCGFVWFFVVHCAFVYFKKNYTSG